jgi:hypothetical protein
MLCLYDEHELNAYSVLHVCLSVRVIQVENRWANLDETRHGLYAIGVYHKIVLLNFYNR